MWRKSLSFRWRIAPLLATVLMAGCRPADQIAVYTVPKPEKIIPAGESDKVSLTPTSGQGNKAPGRAVPARMIAAMFLVGNSGWFFKATGDIDKLGAKEPEILAFLKSVRFADEQKPTWELPGDWTDREERSEFRYTTLVLGDAKPPLELAVSRLEKSLPNETAYALVNINRWRGQLGLKDLKPDELAAETTALEIDGKKCFLVNYVGEMAAGGGMRPPFAGGEAPGPARSTPESTPPAAAQSELKFERPAGWKLGQLNQFRQAAFEVADGKQKVEITVTTFPLGTGTLLANVNRWREQVQLKPLAESELADAVKSLPVGAQTGKYVALTGEGENPKGLLGVIVETSDRMWFVKLIGDADLAQREKPNFEAFAKSLQLP